MAAFLRSGARKLVPSALAQRTPAAGALVQPSPVARALPQRTKASGAVDLRHLFLPRSFMTTATMEHARARPQSLSKAMEEIQEKKDELYDLLSKEKPTDSLNRQLLRSLSTHVSPRPDDSEWRWMSSFKMFEDVMGSTITMLGPLLAVTVILADKAADYLDKKKAEAGAAAKEKKLAHV